MTKPDFDVVIDWPKEGLMTLVDAFRKLREIWGPDVTIATRLWPGPKDKPCTLIEAWPIYPNSQNMATLYCSANI
jgi:hypothetical protein